MKFYTYMWLRADATPYYVGKCQRTSRARKHLKWESTHAPSDASRIIIQFWSSEAEAFEIEKFYIRLFGRKDNGTGILRNRTDGGDGPHGAIRDQSFREHIREVNIGNKNASGKRSKDFCRLMSVALTGRKLAAAHIKNLADSKRGIPLSKEHRQNIRAGKLAYEMKKRSNNL